MPTNTLGTFLGSSLRDFLDKPYPVKATQHHLAATLDWLLAAQKSQADGGVSAYISLRGSWAPSFIETTGYIISTFLAADSLFPKKKLGLKAKKMANFVVRMQLANGGYRTYPPGQKKTSEPTIFNTGQDILGLCDYYQATGQKKYLASALKAAEFLVQVQNTDGTWTKYQPDAKPHTYDARVAWAVIRVGKLVKRPKLIAAARKQLNWVVKQQLSTGWFRHCLLPGLAEEYPVTHTIAYTIEGLLASGLLLKEPRYVRAATLAAEHLLRSYQRHHQLWATYDQKWQPQSTYICLTGTAQIAGIWFDLATRLKLPKFIKPACQLNLFLKSLQNTEDLHSVAYGGVKGSHPIYGSLLPFKGYCREAYINWAAKFFADSLLKEHALPKGIQHG